MKKYFEHLLKFLWVFGVMSMFASFAHADVMKIATTDKNADEAVTEGKVYFSGDVTRQKVSNLTQSIDDLNITYKNLKKIYLYIDSYGGSMDSGHIAYWAVKSSRTPITAVNLSTVMSAATMMFCGARERQSLQGGRFIIHPARIAGENYSFQPDQLEDFDRDLKGINQMFADTYAECTNLSDSEIQSALHSESLKKILLPDKAKEKGVISKLADRVADTPVAYYITDKDKD